MESDKVRVSEIVLWRAYLSRLLLPNTAYICKLRSSCPAVTAMIISSTSFFRWLQVLSIRLRADTGSPCSCARSVNVKGRFAALISQFQKAGSELQVRGS